MKPFWILFWMCLGITALGGCYTMDFYHDIDPLRDKPDGKISALSTIFSAVELESAYALRKTCPGGVSRLRMQQRVSDGVFHYMTFGFYSPQTVEIWCKRRKHEF